MNELQATQPKPEYAIFRDGTAWFATGKEFVNLQESPAGFGETPLAALGALMVVEGDNEARRCEGLRRWKCHNCQTVFERGRVSAGVAPGCPRCKAGAQYVCEHSDRTDPTPPDIDGGSRKEQSTPDYADEVTRLLEAWAEGVRRWRENHDSIPTAFLSLALEIGRIEAERRSSAPEQFHCPSRPLP